MDNLATVSRKNSQICHSSRRLSKHCAETRLCGAARVGQAITVAEQIGDDAGEHIEVVAVGERGAVDAQPFERAILLGVVVLTQPVEEADAAAAHSNPTRSAAPAQDGGMGGFGQQVPFDEEIPF